MSNSNISMSLTLEDKASGELKRFNDALKGLESLVAKASQNMASLGTSMTKLGTDASAAAAGVKELTSSVRSLGNASEKLGQKSQEATQGIKAIEQATGGALSVMSRFAFAVQQLGIELTALRSEMRGVASGLTGIANVANNSNASLGQHSTRVRQVTQDYNEMSRAMVGAVQMWAANKIGGAFKDMGKAGMQEEQQQARMINAGMSGSDREQANKITRDLATSSTGKNFSASEIRSAVTDMFLENGDMKQVREMSGQWMDMLSVLRSNAQANGSDIDMAGFSKLAKAADMKAAFTSMDRLKEFSDVIVQASNTLGPETVNPESVRQLIQYLKGSKYAVDADGMRALLSAADKLKSSTVGLSADGILKKSMGVGIQKSELQSLNEAGLVDSLDGLEFKKSGELDLEKSKKQFKLKGIEIMQKNIKKWADEVLRPAMELDGVDLNSAIDVRNWINKRFNNSNQSNLLSEFILNKDSTDRDVQNQKKAANTKDSKAVIDENSSTAFSNMKNRATDLYETLGKLLNPTIKKVADSLADMFNWMNKIATDNPTLAKFALMAVAIGGVALAVSSLITWFGGLASIATMLGVSVTAGASSFTLFASVLGGVVGVISRVVLMVTGAWTAFEQLGVIVKALAGDVTVSFTQIVAAIGTITAGVAIFGAGMMAMQNATTLTLGMIMRGFLRAFGIVGLILMLAEPIANFKVGGTKLIEWAFIIGEGIVDGFKGALATVAQMVIDTFNFVRRNAAKGLAELADGAASIAKYIPGGDKAAGSIRSFAESLRVTGSNNDNFDPKVYDAFKKDHAATVNRIKGVLATNAANANEKVSEGGVDGAIAEIEAKSKAAQAQIQAELEKSKAEQAKIMKEIEANKAKYEQLVKENENKNGNGNGRKYNKEADQAMNEFKEIDGKMKQQLETLDAQLKNGLINFQDYAAKKREIITSTINEEIKALEKERAAFEAAGNMKGVNRVDRMIDLKKSEMENRLKQLEAEESGKAIKAKQFEMELDQKIGEITGNRRAASIAKLDEEISKLREKAALEGASPEAMAKIDKYESMARAKVEYDDLMVTVKRYGDVSDLAHKKAASAAKLGEITETEAARRSEEAYREEGQAIEAVIPKLEELAQKTGNPELLKNIEELKIKSHELANQVGEDSRKMKDEIGGAFEGLFNDLSSGKGIKAALNNFANSIVQTINKALSKQMSEAINGMLFGTQKDGSFTGGIGNFLQGIISPKGFNQGGAGGLSGLFGGGGENAAVDGLGQAANKAMTGLNAMTTNGVQGATNALGENIAKTVMGTSAESMATSALQMLASAAQSAAAALQSMGGGGGMGGGGMLGGLFGGGGTDLGFLGSFGTIASFDVGAWDLSQDQMAMVHKNEMIIPAEMAGNMRKALESGTSGAGSSNPVNVVNHFTIQGPTTLQSQQQIGKAVLDGMSRASRRNG